MRARLRLAHALVACCVAGATIAATGVAPAYDAPEPAGQKTPALAQVLDQASAYVSDYEPRLGGLVVHEDYVQWMTGNETRRRLSADLVMVRLDEKSSWLAFRNVLEVDGVPILDRDERLTRIFADPSVQSLRDNAQRIVNESARYNIGGRGNINVPPFALMFLRPANLGRFRFQNPRPDSIDRTIVWRVDYQESAHPTIIKDQDRVSDAPADGSFWFRPGDGAVMRTLIHTGDHTYDSQVKVDYCMARGLDLLVPCVMTETYSSGRNRVGGEAKYSDVRRFGVTTSTEIK